MRSRPSDRRRLTTVTRSFAALLVSTLTLLMAGLTFPPAASAHDGNDNFANSFYLDGLSPSTSTNNVGATKEAGEPNHAGFYGGQSVWYAWVAPINAKVTLESSAYCSSCGTQPTGLLAVYTGSSVSGLSSLGSRASSYPAVTFNAVAGRTYRIAVDTSGAAADSISLWLSARPANDPFASPRVLPSVSSGSVAGTNVNATRQSGEPVHADESSAYPSVWHSWAPADSGTARFDVAGDFDSVLAVYRGTGLTALTEVAANDDCPDTGGVDSCVSFDAVAGTAYRIAVAGLNYSYGDFTLTYGTSPPPPPCSNVINGTEGADVLTGTVGADCIYGLGGNDKISGLGGNDVIDGGTGVDYANYATAPSGIVVNLASGTASGGHGSDTLIGIERSDGSNYNDTLTGDAQDNLLAGKGGNDSVFGGDGADIVYGGLGIDSVYGGVGNDRVEGVDGNDSLYGDAGNDTMLGGVGTDRCDGGIGTDTQTSCETRISIP